MLYRKIITLLLFVISFYSAAQCLLLDLPFHGNTLDASGNSNHASNNGASLTTDRFGNINSAYYFDGINDYIETPHFVRIPEFSEISISAWFYCEPTNGKASNRYSGISFGKKEDGEMFLRVSGNNNDNFQAGLASGSWTSRSSVETSDSATIKNNWYHLVGVYRSNDIELWVNGIKQKNTRIIGTGGNFGDVPATTPMWIGRAFNSNNTLRHFKGKIDDVKIFGCNLDSTDIKNLFQHGSLMSTSQVSFNKEAMKVYPNPTSSTINVEFSTGTNELETMQLFDVLGKEVMTQNFYGSSHNFDLSVLPTGIYLMKVKLGSKSYSKKLIKI